MKIEEILSEIKFKPRISNKSTSGVLQSPRLQFIAAGCQAIAYYHKTHPNTVVKVAAVSGEDDPIWQFLRVCINHPNNPYFPKIFNHKVFNLQGITPEEIDYLESQPEFEYLPIHDNRKMQILIVTELLQETDSEQFETSLNRIGILDYIVSMKPQVQAQRRAKYNITTEFAWIHLMDTPQFRREIRNLATDKHFKDAMRLLEPLFANTRFYADVHLANMMTRRNGHLVFNDPLALALTG
jgi:hypothetical protein